jgi:hypothetical protein
MQEGRAVHSHVDERRLHSGQHPGYFAKNDIADSTAVGRSFYLKFRDDAVFDEGDAGFSKVTIDDENIGGRHEDTLSVDPDLLRGLVPTFPNTIPLRLGVIPTSHPAFSECTDKDARSLGSAPKKYLGSGVASRRLC